MLSQEVINFLSVAGGIASIVALCLLILGYLKKAIASLKRKKREQDEHYSRIRDEISNLANQGTSSSKRLDVFMFSSAALAEQRHYENIIRMGTYSGALIFFVLIPQVAFVFGKDTIEFTKNISILFALKAAMVSFVLLGLACNLYLGRYLIHLSKHNESHAQGYLNVMNSYIVDKYRCDET